MDAIFSAYSKAESRGEALVAVDRPLTLVLMRFCRYVADLSDKAT